MARSGLKKVVKTVKGKKGSVKRSYWVKSQPSAKKGDYKKSLRYKLLNPIEQKYKKSGTLGRAAIGAGLAAAGSLALIAGSYGIVHAGHKVFGSGGRPAPAASASGKGNRSPGQTGQQGGMDLSGFHVLGQTPAQRRHEVHIPFTSRAGHQRSASVGYQKALRKIGDAGGPDFRRFRQADAIDRHAARHVPFTAKHRRHAGGSLNFLHNLSL